jgi:hypothetical protein
VFQLYHYEEQGKEREGEQPETTTYREKRGDTQGQRHNPPNAFDVDDVIDSRGVALWLFLQFLHPSMRRSDLVTLPAITLEPIGCHFAFVELRARLGGSTPAWR